MANSSRFANDAIRFPVLHHWIACTNDFGLVTTGG